MNDAVPACITMVITDGCHFCADADDALAALARTHCLEVEVVDAAGERGRRLVTQHRATMFPLVLLDGEFFSHGRLPRRKLAHELDVRGYAGQVG